MEEIINKLKRNPIFKMSLGSKELFHSNFLEYLWEINREAFVEMINDIYPSTLVKEIDYKFARELENFDICIYHEESKKKRIYDLVIENKVKSIPYKEQLLKYADKAKHSNCRFILLTLSADFPDKEKKEIDSWVVCDYATLSKRIASYFLTPVDERNAIYIRDYCDFVDQLDELKKKNVIPENIYEKLLFDSSEIDKLKSIRLHDLYIKLRCSWFALKLKEELQSKGIREIFVCNKFAEREPGINLNTDINQGNGQIAAWICDNDKNVFEVVIQGNQYRHGINQLNVRTFDAKINILKSKDDRCTLLNAYYDRLEELPAAKSFLNFDNSEDALPNKIHNFIKTKTLKHGPFCCYGDDYIYRYIEVGNMPIGDLLHKMVTDIEKVYRNTPKL